MLTTKNIFLCLIIIHFLGLFNSVSAQMVEGTDMPNYEKVFNVDLDRELPYDAKLISSNAPGNVFWPGDDPEFTFQIQNKSSQPLEVKGKVDVIAYGTKGKPGDIWTPHMFRNNKPDSSKISVNITSKGFANFTIDPQIPQTKGGYALVVDLGRHGRKFLTTFVRTFKHITDPLQYPSFCLDDISHDVLHRLGVQAIRHGISFKPTSSPDFEEWYRQETKKLEDLDKHNISVLAMMGAPAQYGKHHPMGLTRAHLNENGVMQNTKCDFAWLPKYDDEFKKVVYKLASNYGWPKGPINAFSLWNEPWEGTSISGWQADMLRYRKLYRLMAEAVKKARRENGVEVLIGGGSSTSNALDKFFCTGTGEFLDIFDFCSIHYQGLHSYATMKNWVNRESPYGRVRIWDTESWVANTDDRVATVIATDRSAGYDRAMGVYRGNIAHTRSYDIKTKKDQSKQVTVDHTYSIAASIGASQHFIGEREFDRLLFKNGLPWVMLFNGLPDKQGNTQPDDGTAVIVGDIGEAFGHENILFRTARGLKEVRHEEKLRKKLAAIPDTAKNKRKEIQRKIDRYEVLDGASMTIKNDNNKFMLYDFYGNPVSVEKEKIKIPLDGRGFFLRVNKDKSSFRELVQAIRNSKIEGIEPLETIIQDFTKPLSGNPTFQVELTNVLNRPVKGKLDLQVNHLEFEEPLRKLKFQAHETKKIAFTVSNGASQPDNTYPLRLTYETKNSGKAVHEEDIHVNYISKRNISVDGDLSDWQEAIPQPVKAEEFGGGPTMTEAAWRPFKEFDQSVSKGLANGYVAYDEDYFYFAAKVADHTPDEGMPRFSNRNEDAAFYPDTCFIPFDKFRFGGAMKHDGFTFSVRWEGKIKPEFSEKYTFTLLHDDQARMWIDGRKLIDENHGGSTRESEASMELQRGKAYDIRVEYAQRNAPARVKLMWSSANQDRETVPMEAFRTNSNEGLTASYYNGPVFNVLRTQRIDETIDFSWAEGEVPDPEYRRDSLVQFTWPEGVRNYSYRRNPELPAGNSPNHDNIQIAFNVVPLEEENWYPNPPGTMPKYTNYKCTDHEYALNPVADKYGGGTEIWRLRYPGMPLKHFYPRQPSSPYDGAVKKGKLKIRRKGNTLIYEAAIPWSEIPKVRERIRNDKPVKFSYRVNNNAGSGCMELSRGRSVAKRNGSFMVSWKEHWANELKFGYEK